MSGAALSRRISKLAVGSHLPYRTVRKRLTLLYGGLFLVSGAVLMAITYALLVGAGFVFTLQSGTPAATSSGAAALFGSETHPSARTMAHWRGVAQCMRDHGVAGFPNPVSSIPLPSGGVRQLDTRDGAVFAIPMSVDTQSATFAAATTACGFSPDYTTLSPQDSRRRTLARDQLLLDAGIALVGMSLLSLGLGWLMAGRVLQPLADSYDAQRQFVANASHELRAPLARQRALIQVALADPDAGAAALRSAHERALAAEQQLEQMIDGLLALTRSQSGLERNDPVDLGTLTTEALAARRMEADALAIEVSASLATAPIAGDQRLLERLIANLLDNAIRHNVAGGRLEVASGIRERRSFLTVENTGQEIPADQIERLFQPFERLGGARTDHGGHGLGLSIVQAIVSAHGAQLSARPRPTGGLAVELLFTTATRRDMRTFDVQSRQPVPYVKSSREG
jgi:signal transduction histidine kinase